MAESQASAASIEVNEAVFCSQHQKEICEECPFDGREENDSFFGLTPLDREPLELPTSTLNKDSVWQCKKHGSTECNLCYNWKKQLNKLHAKAKKAGKKSL